MNHVVLSLEFRNRIKKKRKKKEKENGVNRNYIAKNQCTDTLKSKNSCLIFFGSELRIKMKMEGKEGH